MLKKLNKKATIFLKIAIIIAAIGFVIFIALIFYKVGFFQMTIGKGHNQEKTIVMAKIADAKDVNDRINTVISKSLTLSSIVSKESNFFNIIYNKDLCIFMYCPINGFV